MAEAQDTRSQRLDEVLRLVRDKVAPEKRELLERFPDAQVFMDLDSIEAALPFAKVIRDAVDTCAVLVALIGRQWMTITGEEGRRRLDNPGDYVRFEVQAALDVKAAAANAAADLAERLLTDRLQTMTSDPLIDRAVADLAGKLQ